ncbi:hypothetical protein FRC00_011886 [Tulasnella sp. 408]|nr:hypothetical protein FRC00_011886 [Tulasnella sp. 408]
MEDQIQTNHPVAVGARQAYARAPAKKKNKKKEDVIPFDQWEDYLSEIPALITAALEAMTVAELDAALDNILTNVFQTKKWGEGATKVQLSAHMGRSRIASVRSILDHSRILKAAEKANFRAKRHLMRSTLHLNVRELIFKTTGLIEVVRTRDEPKAPNRKFLLDSTNMENVARKFGSDGIGLDAIQVGGQGWLVIDAGQSCIVRNDCGEIEFIALRGAISTADLVDFIDLNAKRAADNFRGLRTLGTGFSLSLNGKEYDFERAPRAPPEVYWSKNYASRAHKENTSTPYAISYTARRTEMADPNEELPPFGGDFVDIGLKVMMRQASDTLFVFRARQYHGTTPMHQVQQTGVVYPFSARLQDAYDKAKKAETVELDPVYSAGDAAMVDTNI